MLCRVLLFGLAVARLCEGCEDLQGHKFRQPQGFSPSQKIVFNGFELTSAKKLPKFEIRVHKELNDSGELCAKYNGGKKRIHMKCHGKKNIEGQYMEIHTPGNKKINVCHFWADGFIKPAVTRTAEPRCVKTVTGKQVTQDDHISTAACPGDLIVYECECMMVNGGICDGQTVTRDGKTCRAHAGQTRQGLKAKACCGLKDGSIYVETVPAIAIDSSVSIPDRWKVYPRAPVANCGTHGEVVTCIVHSYSTDYANNRMPIKKGRSCKTSQSCGKCAVQAICRNRNCLKTVEGGLVSIDDHISAVQCPADMVVRDCECILPNGGICDGVTVTMDGRTCRAHASERKSATKARACCVKKTGNVQVISNPVIMANEGKKVGEKAAKYFAGPVATCPSGSNVVACLGHSYYTDYNAVNTPKMEKRRCSMSSKCKKCGVQAVCVYKCDTTVEGGTVNKDDKISAAKCPVGMIVSRCECFMPNGGFCDGVTVTTDGRECRAHGGQGNTATRSRACCVKKKGSVSVVSNPNSMTDYGKPIWDRFNAYFSNPAARCPGGSKVVTCLGHSYSADYKTVNKPAKRSNGCFLSDACKKCAVQAICKTP